MQRLNGMGWAGVRGAVALAAGLVLGAGAPAWAQEAEGGHVLPHRVDGITMEGGMTWYLQGTDGLKKGAQPSDAADLTYTLDLGLSAKVTEKTSLNVAFEAGDGNGVDGRLGSLSTANYDAFITEVSAGQNFPNLSQAYLASEFADGGVTLEFGKLDIHSHYDDNAFANDETAQFMSGIFVRSAGTSYGELDGYYAPGVAATVAAGDHVKLHGVVANGNGSGFDGVSDRPYAAAQVTLSHGEEGGAGNFRLYGIRDARRYVDLNGQHTENIAWGVSLDQALGNLGLFGRYSAQKDDIQSIHKWDAATGTYSIVEPANLVTGAWSGGMQLGGALWGRDADAVGIGYGVVQANTKNPEWALLTVGIPNPDDETHLEVYYSLAVSDHLAFTADAQQIDGNGGDPAADTIRVYGVRGQINF